MIHPRLYEKLSAEAAETDTLPVILYYCRPRDEVRRCITHRYGSIKYELPFINAMALDLPAHKLTSIAREPMIQWITDDIAVSKVEEKLLPLALSAAPPMDRSDIVLSRQPVAVAVIDTGVALHPDLIFPTNRIRAFCDLVNHRTIPYDDDGHGTHIAGIISGLAKIPRKERAVSGAAHPKHSAVWSPDIVAVKALDQDGNGNASDILAAMQWVLNNSRFYNIRVVNLSLGVTADDNYNSDPLIRGVEALTRRGITVVAAAGNSGPKPHTISSPGICQSAITVGASDGDHVASFSGRGPTPQGLSKPDLVAPGVDILSLDAKAVDAPSAAPSEDRIAAGIPTEDRGSAGIAPGYIRQSGTSMAAPFVSRAAADICREFPFAGPALIKHLLLTKTRPLPDEPPEAQGRGVLVLR